MGTIHADPAGWPDEQKAMTREVFIFCLLFLLFFILCYSSHHYSLQLRFLMIAVGADAP